jgi:hypothetical protein
VAKFDQQPIQIDERREDFIEQPGFGNSFTILLSRRRRADAFANSQKGIIQCAVGV